MSIVEQRTKYCLRCAYAVWPQHELGYCAHPESKESQTVECRDLLGACGPTAKLYKEMPNEKTI
jgi:hypothetical protein